MRGVQRTDVAGDDRCVSMHTRHKEEANRATLAGQCDILLIGDSIVQQMPQNKFYEQSLPKGKTVLNFGIGGDRVEHVLWRIQDGDWLDNLKPKIVVLFVGTNNVNCEPSQVANSIFTTVSVIKEKVENAHIVLPHLLPRGQFPNKLRDQNCAVNNLIAAGISADGKKYNKVHHIYTGHCEIIGDDGSIDHKIMHDYLHLTDQGYRITWKGVFEKCNEILESN